MQVVEDKGFVYEFDGFRLDPRQRVLSREGQPLRLQPKEFETLLVLVENNGRVVSKDELMAAIWPNSFVEESNLTKKISTLRKLLNRKGVQFIETVPKHGYRFSADLHLVLPEEKQPFVIEKRTV